MHVTPSFVAARPPVSPSVALPPPRGSRLSRSMPRRLRRWSAWASQTSAHARSSQRPVCATPQVGPSPRLSRKPALRPDSTLPQRREAPTDSPPRPSTARHGRACPGRPLRQHHASKGPVGMLVLSDGALIWTLPATRPPRSPSRGRGRGTGRSTAGARRGSDVPSAHSGRRPKKYATPRRRRNASSRRRVSRHHRRRDRSRVLASAPWRTARGPCRHQASGAG